MRRKWILGAALVSGVGIGVFLMTGKQPLKNLQHSVPLAINSAPTTLYQWRNADGSIEVGNQPPPNGVPYITMELKDRLNRAEPVELKKEEESRSGSTSPLSVYTPSGMQQMLKDAQNAAELTRRSQQDMQNRIENAQ